MGSPTWVIAINDRVYIVFEANDQADAINRAMNEHEEYWKERQIEYSLAEDTSLYNEDFFNGQIIKNIKVYMEFIKLGEEN